VGTGHVYCAVDDLLFRLFDVVREFLWHLVLELLADDEVDRLLFETEDVVALYGLPVVVDRRDRAVVGPLVDVLHCRADDHVRVLFQRPGLIRVDADREPVCRLCGVENPRSGTRRGVVDDVGPVLVLRCGDLLARGRVRETPRVPDGDLDVGVHPLGTRLVGALEGPDQVTLLTPDEPDVALLGSVRVPAVFQRDVRHRPRLHAGEIRHLVVCPRVPCHVRLVDVVVYEHPVRVRELRGVLAERLRVLEADEHDQIVTFRGLCLRIAERRDIRLLDLVQLEVLLFLCLLEPFECEVVERPVAEPGVARNNSHAESVVAAATDTPCERRSRQRCPGGEDATSAQFRVQFR